jgi:hypothetical protein
MSSCKPLGLVVDIAADGALQRLKLEMGKELQRRVHS